MSKIKNLIPAIIQEYQSKNILMLGYMNEDALKQTTTTGLVHFWSRSRQKLWLKGEKSGNKLKVKEIYFDCDRDALLITTELVGESVCHTGRKSCFYERLTQLI